MTNAIKFTNNNGEIELSISLKENHVIMKLQDNGIGIPAKMQKIVFDKFNKKLFWILPVVKNMKKIWASNSWYMQDVRTFNVPTRVWGLSCGKKEE